MNILFPRQASAATSEPPPDISVLVPGYRDLARGVFGFGGAVFLLLTPLHYVVIEGAARWPMITSSLWTAIILFACRFAIEEPRVWQLLSHRAMFLTGMLAWINSTVHLLVTGDVNQSTNFGIILIAAGFALVDRREMLIVVSACTLSWAAGLMIHAGDPGWSHWIHFAILLAESLALGVATFFWKERVLQRNYQLRREQARAREAEHQSLLTAQAKAIEAERNLRRALEADASKSMFLANMSHELRTPLNSVLGFAQILRDRMITDPVRVRDYADSIHVSGAHLLTLINQILDFSKANAGALKLHEDWIHVSGTLREIARLLSPQADEAGVKVGLKVEEGLPGFFGDDVRFRQVITNLLANAIKFTPKGGEVTLEGALDRGAITIRVIDTGIGIAAEDLEKVFEPFVQAESGFAKHHQGTGLGLPLSRKLVELHGGAITLDSTPGKGTTVTVRFPPARTEPRDAAAMPAARLLREVAQPVASVA